MRARAGGLCRPAALALPAARSNRRSRQRRVLPLPLGPMRPCTFAGPDLEIDAVDRSDAPKLSDTPFRASRLGCAFSPIVLRQQLRRGGSRDAGSSGRRFLKSSNSAMPPGMASTMTRRSTHRGRWTTLPGYTIGERGQDDRAESGPRIEPRPPIRMAMRTYRRSNVKASGVM